MKILHHYERDGYTVTELMLPMSDGVQLYTRYTVPTGVDKCPIVYKRTPYEGAHNGARNEVELAKDMPMLEGGYALLVQHCRGRHDSEGKCIPFDDAERRDGLETLEFIRTLPFYNGEIYVWGWSYTAFVHWSYLGDCPPDVKGAALSLMCDRLYPFNYLNGSSFMLSYFRWWVKMLRFRYPDPDSECLYQRPYVNTTKRVFGEEVPEFTNMVTHNTPDEFWQSLPAHNVLSKLNIPVLMVGGWYDFFLEGMADMWPRFPEELRQKSVMFLGPFGHSIQLNSVAEYPSEHGNLPRDFAVEWFNHIRENRPYRYAPCGKVTYYSMSGKTWKSDKFPKQAGQEMRYYLGEGVLRDAPLTESKALSYRYDPGDLKEPYQFGNIYEAHEIGSVEGVLSFVSAPFTETTAFMGRIKVNLCVSTDCEDTGFFARVCFVKDGKAYNLTEAVGALSYFVKDYTPNQKVSFTMETHPCAFTIEKGMSIRVDVSSESGRYLPHANVKGHFAYVTDTRVANNTIYTEESSVTLPIESADATPIAFDAKEFGF